MKKLNNYFQSDFAKVLAFFVASRLIIYIVGVIAAASLLNFNTGERSHFEAINPKETWYQWDVEWYEGIAKYGYNPKNPEVSPLNVAFMPGYPLTVGLLMRLVGTNDFFWTATILSNILSIFAIYFIFKYFKSRVKNANEFLLVFFSTAGTFYLSIPYVESLYLFLLGLIFLLTQHKRYLLASFIAGLALATRIQALAFILIPAVDYIIVNKKSFSQLSLAKYIMLFAMGTLFSIPLLSFMYYTHVHYNDPLAFLNGQEYWNNPTPFPLKSITGLFLYPKSTWGFVHSILWFFYVFIIIRNYKRMQLNELLFCVVVLLISSTSELFYAVYRYVLPLIPVIVLITEEKDWVKKAFVYTNLILGTLLLIAFVTGSPIAV